MQRAALGSTFHQRSLESILGLWQLHKKLDQRNDLVENLPHFHLFFRSFLSQIIRLYRAESWHKEGKEHLWLREGGISCLHSSSMLWQAKSGYGNVS